MLSSVMLCYVMLCRRQSTVRGGEREVEAHQHDCSTMVDALHVVVACPNATKATMMTDVIGIKVFMWPLPPPTSGSSAGHVIYHTAEADQLERSNAWRAAAVMPTR